MSLPSFYQAHKVGTLYTPNTLQAVKEGRQTQIEPSSNDQQRIALLLIDMQVDFIHTDGALSVPHAVEDTQRLLQFLYRNLERITTITASLDSHLPLQIFSPSWWVNSAGEYAPPFTIISRRDVDEGLWTPLYSPEWSRGYVHTLENQAKKQLMIWPYHTLIGTEGHNLTPALYEAIAFHSSARQSQPVLLRKGDEPLTEHYSILEPEVKLPDNQVGLNTNYLSMLARYDLIYIAGQAKSHCVLESVNSMMRYFGYEVIRRIRILSDCMSSVAHPQIDFEALAQEAFTKHARNGLQLVKSTDPIA